LRFVFVAFGGRVFFPLAGGTGSVEIWSTDGTPAGTVRAITAASGVRDPKALTVVDGRLYFAARRLGDPSGRVLPWVSDGTDAGTMPLADVELGADSFAPLNLERPAFVQFDDRVYFAASDPVHGEELWATDGTPAGTALVRDIAPGFLGSYPRSLVVWPWPALLPRPRPPARHGAMDQRRQRTRNPARAGHRRRRVLVPAGRADSDGGGPLLLGP
jgi:ELWxxDGT repeat protein